MALSTEAMSCERLQPSESKEPDLDYRIDYSGDLGRKICVHRSGQAPEYAEDKGIFLYLFEKNMTIALERIRHDLYFIHAAALEYKDKLHLLVAESGGGKSTTSWALLHHGFRYASDELAPVISDSMKVLPYTHALCLKADPPPPYSLPKATLYTERTLHIPVDSLPSKVINTALPLESILFVRYRPDAKSPSIHQISKAQAGARVYANGLNQLAHPDDGLDAALQIAQHCTSYELESANLEETCLLVKKVLEKNLRC